MVWVPFNPYHPKVPVCNSADNMTDYYQVGAGVKESQKNISNLKDVKKFAKMPQNCKYCFKISM